MPQQTLRRHDDERLAQRTDHLTAQHVEHLRRGGGHADLDVVLRAQLQEALEPGRRMLRSLALIAMGQEQRESREAAPLRLTGADELVDDDLRAVAEIAELALPDGQAMRFRRREPILEAHHRLLGKHRVGDGEGGLIGGQMLQRHESPARRLIVQHRVTMKKRAASAVLAGEANGVAFMDQTGIGEVLGAAPIQCQVAGHHALSRLHDGQHPRMQVPVGGIRGDRLAQGLEPAHVDRCFVLLPPVGTQVLAPVHGVLVADEAERGARLRLAFVQATAILIHHRGSLRGRQHALRHQAFGIQLAYRRLLADDLVHERLGR